MQTIYQKAFKRMKGYSTWSVINELEIKTVSYHYKAWTQKHQILVKMWSKRNSFIADGNEKWYSHFARQFGSFIQN